MNPKSSPPDTPTGLNLTLPEPVQQRVMVQDATVEKLIELQAVSRGLALVEDELARLLVNKNRYNEGSDVEFFLQAYSGGSYSSDRINRGSQRVDDVYLAIYGTIQPEK